MEQSLKRPQATSILSVLVSVCLALFIAVILLPRSQDTKPLNQKIVRPMPKPESVKNQPVTLALPEPPKIAKKATPKQEPKPKVAVKRIPKSVNKAPPPAMSKPVVKSVAKPVAKPAHITTLKSEARVKPRTQIKQATVHDLSSGRPLLRILEHGKGPSIEIAWPGGSAARNALYSTLTRCYGMTVALMDGSGNLYRSQDPRGQRWDINLDQYSGFVRQPSGSIPQAERNVARIIARQHPHLSGAHEVRIFPRRVDAILLGSLNNLIGTNYTGARSIHAQYVGSGRQLLVQKIMVDGKRVAGHIDLSRAARCR